MPLRVSGVRALHDAVEALLEPARDRADAAALILEFAALVWLRLKRPEMARPFRVPFGVPGVIAISLPPVALCLISIALSNDATRYLSLAGIALGLLVYRWQSGIGEAIDVEVTPT